MDNNDVHISITDMEKITNRQYIIIISYLEWVYVYDDIP